VSAAAVVWRHFSVRVTSDLLDAAGPIIAVAKTGPTLATLMLPLRDGAPSKVAVSSGRARESSRSALGGVKSTALWEILAEEMEPPVMTGQVVAETS
jgi:hypothetical protein